MSWVFSIDKRKGVDWVRTGNHFTNSAAATIISVSCWNATESYHKSAESTMICWHTSLFWASYWLGLASKLVYSAIHQLSQKYVWFCVVTPSTPFCYLCFKPPLKRSSRKIKIKKSLKKNMNKKLFVSLKCFPCFSKKISKGSKREIIRTIRLQISRKNILPPFHIKSGRRLFS